MRFYTHFLYIGKVVLNVIFLCRVGEMLCAFPEYMKFEMSCTFPELRMYRELRRNFACIGKLECQGHILCSG